MKTPFLSNLAAAILLSGCGAGFEVSVVVGDHDHDHPDDFPITFARISACPDSGNGFLSHVYGCMTGVATGQVSYSNQICSLVITDSGRITLGIAGSNYFQSFYIYPDDASYVKWSGLAPGSFELTSSNRFREFSMRAAWPGSSAATMSVSIGSLSCNFLL